MGIDHDNFVLSKYVEENFFSILEKEEQAVFENHIQHLHEITLVNVMPRLKHLFSEDPLK